MVGVDGRQKAALFLFLPLSTIVCHERWDWHVLLKFPEKGKEGGQFSNLQIGGQFLIMTPQ